MRKPKDFPGRLFALLVFGLFFAFGSATTAVHAVSGDEVAKDGTYSATGSSITANIWDDEEDQAFPTTFVPSAAITVYGGKITDFSITSDSDDPDVVKGLSELSSSIMKTNSSLIGGSATATTVSQMIIPDNDINRNNYSDVKIPVTGVAKKPF